MPGMWCGQVPSPADLPQYREFLDPLLPGSGAATIHTSKFKDGRRIPTLAELLDEVWAFSMVNSVLPVLATCCMVLKLASGLYFNKLVCGVLQVSVRNHQQNNCCLCRTQLSMTPPCLCCLGCEPPTQERVHDPAGWAGDVPAAGVLGREREPDQDGGAPHRQG